MKSFRIILTRFKYFIWTPRISKYLQEFSWNFWDFENIFFMNQKIYLDFSRFILSLKIYSERLKSFLFSSRSGFNMFCSHQVPCSLIFHLDQTTPETESYLDFGIFRRYFAIITVSSDDQYHHSKILVPTQSLSVVQTFTSSFYLPLSDSNSFPSARINVGPIEHSSHALYDDMVPLVIFSCPCCFHHDNHIYHTMLGFPTLASYNSLTKSAAVSRILEVSSHNQTY